MAEAQSNSVVVADGVIKQFGRFAALRGVSAEFVAGKLSVVLGDNGAGKTTLLRIVAGLAYPTRGTISVLGTNEIKEVRAQIGYMAHPSLLYDEMSGMENLRYFAQLYEIPAGDVERRCCEAIASVKLDPGLERPVGQYSQALLNDPKLLLLDEPFSNVDARSAAEMAALVGAARDRGKTVFVVTHQPVQLERYADEFISMEAGRIVNRTTSLRVAAR
jgi:ABC-type multidrug transport system ATPase subunit